MSFVEFKNVSLDYPLISSNSETMKKLILSKLSFGLLKNDSQIKRVSALKNINLTISQGEKVGIIGANGSGKTTLLRMISSVFNPSHGVVNIHGSISSLIDLISGANLDASGIDNIRIRLILMGYSKNEINNVIDDIVSFSELGEFIYLPCKAYSTGMLLRLFFSIMTSIKSDIILLDEWMSVGDSEFEKKAQKRLRSYLVDNSIFIMASHNIQLIESMCNRVITLDKGKIISDKKM